MSWSGAGGRSWALTLLVLFTLGVLAAALVGRMFYGARGELGRAEQAASRGDLALERVHLRRALAYYFPGNPWVERATRRLLQRAEEAEVAGRPRRALRIWRELRGAILALRGVGQPLSEPLARANRRIAALRPMVTGDQRRSPSEDAAAQRAAQLRRLQHPEAPDRGWTAAAVVGFVLLVIGLLLFNFYGLSVDLRLLARRAWPLLALTGLGLALFLGGLANA